MIIEEVIRKYLDDELDVNVYTELPSDRPVTYVSIEKTGSSVSNRLHTATLAVQSVAASLYEAAKLNEVVKSAMDGAVSLNGLSQVVCQTDYNFTNTKTKERRYQAVYEIYYTEE